MTAAKAAPRRAPRKNTTAAVAAAATGPDTKTVERTAAAPSAPAVLDLDNAVRPPRPDGEPHPEPFSFSWKGKRWELVDPAECSWQDLMLGLRGPGSFLRFTLRASDEEKALLMTTPMEAWRLGLVMNGWFTHYGFDPAALGLPGLSG